VYSPLKEGLFCKFCPFFVPDAVRGGVALQKLVTEPANNYAKIMGSTGSLESHMKTSYHMEAVLAGQDFLHTFKNPDQEVGNQLQSQRLLNLEHKKILIKKVVETIALCGRQNIALRGHGYSVILTLEAPDYNDGNLRSLLRFRANFSDEVLKRKLTDNKSKFKKSPQHQNEFFRLCGEEI